MNDGKWKMTNDKLDSVEAVVGFGSFARPIFSQLQGGLAASATVVGLYPFRVLA